LNFISSDDGFTREEKVKFIRPVSLEISPRGDILVGDEGLGACFKLDQFFNYIFEFGGRDDIYSVIYPSSIEYHNNKIYVTDSDYGYVFAYDDFGMMTGKLGQEHLREPTSIAISSQTGIWIADRSASTLHAFNFRGREIFRWSGQGEFRLATPVDIFIDHNGRLFITDSNTSRIYILIPATGS
jgi:DNA-binding beta-propeller fold protein YncE